MRAKSKHTNAVWRKLLENYGSNALLSWFEECYGKERQRIGERADRLIELLDWGQRDDCMDPAIDAVIGRTPCRARVFGGHTDFPGCGGYLINMAGNLEMHYLGQGRKDDKVVLRNMNPDFEACEFHLGDWDVRPEVSIKTADDWDQWCTWVETNKKREFKKQLEGQTGFSATEEQFNERWRGQREKNWQDFVKGIVAYLQTDLGDPGRKLRERLHGFYALYASEIPTGWGLSSSSALVMSTARLLNVLFALGLSDDQIINLGYCEHYNGTRGGMNDHATIIRGIGGRILLMRSFPEEIAESSPFPEGVSLFLVDSGVKRSQAPAVSAKLMREGIKDPAIILARTGIGYSLACLWIRHHFPQHEEALRSYSPAEPYGLLRELNSGGRVPFQSEEQRTREIYRILGSMPREIGRAQLLAGMPEFVKELEALFATHPEPKGGYHLRGMALYGLAENERSLEYLKRAKAGDFAGMQKLMQVSHNGDRIASYTVGNGVEEKPFCSPDSDEELAAWQGDPGGNPVWQIPGYFERSIEKVDLLCDTIAHHFGEVATARISAAGLGGAAVVLSKTAWVDRIRTYRSERGYESIPPVQPSAGASVVEE